MKINDYVSSLLPSLGKDSVLEQIRLAQAELKQLSDVYRSAQTFFKSGYQFKAEESKKVVEQIKRFSETIGSKNVVVAINEKLKKLDDNLDEYASQVSSHFDKTIVTAGLTYPMATLMQLIEYTVFSIEYARRLLTYLTTFETVELEGGGIKREEINDAITPAAQAFVVQQADKFGNVWDVVTADRTTVKDNLVKIPEIVVKSSDYKLLTEQLGGSKLDPFRMGFLGTKLWPFFWLAEVIAGLQANRFYAAKAERELLQMKLLNLEMTSKGKPDAKLQFKIQYLEDELQKLDAKIARMEEDYA